MAKDKKPTQDIPEEENVITPDEFEELEKKEGRPRLGLFSKRGKSRPLKRPEKDSFQEKGSDNLFLSVEKLQAKLETFEELRQATDEKISRLSEEIGELRSSILEKDRMFNKIEGGFEKVKEIMDELQPSKIRADLEKKEDLIEKVNAKAESAELKISEVKKSLSSIQDVMEKVKDLKNLMAISDNVNKKMARMEEERKQTTKIAAKIESMFSELTEKTAEFHQYRDKIDFSAESMHDLMKALDMLEVRVENSVAKDDFKKLDDRFETLENDLTDKIKVIRDIVDEVVTDLKKGGVKEVLAKQGKSRVDEINKRLSGIDSYEKGMKGLTQELGKVKEEKDKEVASLMSELDKLKKAQSSYTIKAQPTPEQKSQPEKPKSQSQGKSMSMQPGRDQALITPVTASTRQYEQPEDVESMMEQCHVHIDRGEIEQARGLYDQILSIYEQSKDGGSGYVNPDQVYGKLKRLYYRLQIYH